MSKLQLIVVLAVVSLSACSRPSQGTNTASASVTVATIMLPTLKCNTCVSTVHRALTSLDGIESADVNLEGKNVTVKFLVAKLDVGKIRDEISQAGYDADDTKRDSTAYENLPPCCK